MENNPRVAVVGCGYWGKNLVRDFAELGALAAIVDESPKTREELSKAHNTVALPYEEVLADKIIDGIVIAAPAEFHAELAIKALNAKKHVYIEKPIALKMTDAEAIKQAGIENDRLIMVGHLLQYHPAFEKLVSLVRSGELGKINYAYSNRLSFGKFRIEENALWSLGVHDVSMILAIFDKSPKKVISTGGAYVTGGIEDECRLELEFDDNQRAHIFASWLHPFKEQKLVVVGEKAMIVFEDSAQGQDKLRLYRHAINRDGRVPEPIKADPEFISFESASPLKSECQHFLDAMAGKHPVRTNADEALRVLEVLTAK